MNTALQDAMVAKSDAAARPIRLMDYRGATLAATFSDAQTEFSSLRESCGVFDLGFRCRIVLTGADRQRWLNGMVTNNVRDLAVGHSVYAFLLNPQGHILGDMYAFNSGDSIIVDTDRSQLEKILATFDHYIIMDDVNVTSFAGRLTALGIAGPKSRQVLEAAGMAIPELQPLQAASATWQGVEYHMVRGEAFGPSDDSYEFWMASEHVHILWQALLGVGAMPLGCEAQEMQRIVSGVPLYGVDIRERDLPQETEQTRALNFNKGCYVGQEIVERIRSRGAVHRKFTGFVVEGTVAAGVKVSSGDKDVGEITSVTTVQIAGIERTLALGYIRRDAGASGRDVMIGPIKATVALLPFDLSAPFRNEPSLATQV